MNPTAPILLDVTLLLDAPQGAYLHYCAELGRGLAGCPEVGRVRLVAALLDRRKQGIDSDERAMIDDRLEVEVLGPSGPSKWGRYAAFARRLAGHLWALARARSAVVHVHTATGFHLLDLGLLVLYRSLGLALVRTVHEFTAAERIRRPTEWERRIGRWQLRLVDAIIAHAPETAETVRALVGSKAPPIVVIPHGNYLMLRGTARPSAGRPPGQVGAPVALFLGIKRHKGIEVFLEALRRLDRDGYRIKGLIAGGINPGDEDLLEVIKAVPNVDFRPGYIPNSELGALYHRSDFVVLPYLVGTTSGAIHLAYAFKRPVVVSDLPCFRELVVEGATGVVVPRGDVDALAAAMRRLADSPADRARMGEEGFRLVSSARYDWARIARETVGVYQRALHRRRRAAVVGAYREAVG